MTVLMVDDQISILSGLISGIDWDALGITSIRTASNALQARKILTNEAVDILLCDIEMPAENWLSLLRWARNNHMDLVCVFLTSHADFLYAKEAMQLDCFDYILQPARYEEIQAAIAKAIARVEKGRIRKELEQYGALAKNHTGSLFQSLFLDWSAGKALSVSALCAELQRLGIDLQPKSECFIILVHLFHWRTEPWPAQEWTYTMNNILSEVYVAKRCGILPFSIDSMSSGWFVYAPVLHFACQDHVLLPLEEAYSTLAAHFPCKLAFYVTPVVLLEQINTQSDVLLRAKQNNILRESGIFSPAGQPDRFHITSLPDVTQLRHWEDLLAKGHGETVYSESTCYLGLIADKGKLTWDALRGFWIQFQQISLNASWTVGLRSESFLPLLEKGWNAQSLHEMQTAIRKITDCFTRNDRTEKKLAEKIAWYVEDNIDQPIGVSDVASAFFMNPDYLSRLFKNEKGITLKEYIVQRKMQSAQVLLRTTSLPVSIIASKLGYDNFSHFSQAYRKKMGLSPTDERNLHSSSGSLS